MSTTDDIRDLRIQVTNLSITVAGGLEQFKVLVKQQQKLLDKLTKVVLDGNGGDSLTTEIAVIKERLERGMKTFSEIKDEQDKLTKQLQDQNLADTKGRWAARVAVITGLAAVGIALLK